MSELKFNVVELQKINLKFGDVLSVKLVGDDFDEYTTQSLQEHLKSIFPENKIMVFTMPTGSDIVFEAVTKDGYCTGCDCGKKEKEND